MPGDATAIPPTGFDTPVELLAGVGPTQSKHLRKLKIETLRDLLEYFPRDYIYEAAETSIDKLAPGSIQMARGEVVACDYISGRGRARFEATLDDGTGKLALTWFNSAFMRGQIHPGMMVRVQGTVKIYRNLPQMTQPKWTLIDEATEPVETSAFRAIYPASIGIKSDAIARIIDQNLDTALPLVEEWFDEKTLANRGLIGRREAFTWIHFPADMEQAHKARRRLMYDELMLMQLGLAVGRRLRDGRLTAPVMRIDAGLDARIRKRFPFDLTEAQTNCIWQIVKDLQSGRPMNRLLQGDVGSGKTVVAVYGMLLAVANKMQAALLAPTEVLAEQHFVTLSNLLKDSSVKIDLFTGRTKRQSRGHSGVRLAAGHTHLAVGTQALLQADIEFANLGLVVVDEQHKLGVQQRASLKSKGLSPHYLVMTATPIPRTLALSYFADFDVSNINALPPGRVPIKTRLIRAPELASAWAFVRSEVKKGRQAYVVYPRIDDDGVDDAKSVVKQFEMLGNGPLKGLRLSMLHGHMKTEEKQAVMLGFRDGQSDVLVATTVIEVGIDVRNATVMVIGDADRFGLSQLHQLRGRVGRGADQSHCLLLSDAVGETAEARLQAMVDTTDGFEIAEIDLHLRGPGEFFGTRQHGLPDFKLTNLASEMSLLSEAKNDAADLLRDDPQLRQQVHAALRGALREQIGDAVGLAQIG